MQVFFNIINNAVDAMESHEGGVLTVKTARDRGNVIILFSDTGPGIKEPHRVFDPFYTTKPVGKGTGLGLSICFGIVQEHAGKIMCYNGQTGGAVFRVELPAVLAALPDARTASGWRNSAAVFHQSANRRVAVSALAFAQPLPFWLETRATVKFSN